MFDLEKSIADWRRQMLAGGIKTPEPLGELENHLREDMAAQNKTGASVSQSFEIAVQRMGQADALKQEFRSADGSPVTRFVQLAGLACATIGGLFSVWLLANLFHHEMGWTAKIFGLAGVALIIFCWLHGHRWLPVITNRWVRTAIGAACCVAGIVAVLGYIQLFPGFFDRQASEIRIGQLLALFIWVCAALAILGGVGVGLEKAIHQRVMTLHK